MNYFYVCVRTFFEGNCPITLGFADFSCSPSSLSVGPGTGESIASKNVIFIYTNDIAYRLDVRRWVTGVAKIYIV